MAPRFMWLFVVLYGSLGIAAIVLPDIERRIVAFFTRTTPVRFLGVFLIILGVWVFRIARDTGWPMLAQTLGVVHSIAGGVNLILPDAMVVFNEAWIERRPVWHRFMGLLYVAVAYLCYLATVVSEAGGPPTDAV